MSPAEIAALLDERFRLLTGGRRGAVERHQTLRADGRLVVLAAHRRPSSASSPGSACSRGSFAAADATAVVTGDGVDTWDVIDAIGSLVAKSMLITDEAADGTTRYRLLETLRQYAAERLDDTDDPDEWRRRHAEHYAEFAGARRRRALRLRGARVASAHDERTRQPPDRGRLEARRRESGRPRARHPDRRGL